MTEERFTSKTKHTGITTSFWVVVMLLLFSVSCSKDKTDKVAVAFDPESTYTMRTTDISSLVSDSGVIRYRIESPEWLMYEKAAEPYWHFPQGLYGERFDSLFVPEASFKSDTAYYWPNKKLFRGVGNVEITNFKGDFVEAEEMYWDENQQLIYSDTNVRMTTSDGRVLRGVGYRASQSLTDGVILRPTADLPVSDTASDSTKQKTSQPQVETPRPRSPQPLQRLRSVPRQEEPINELPDEPILEKTPDKLLLETESQKQLEITL